MGITKNLAVAGGFFAASVLSVSAAVIDFTDPTGYDLSTGAGTASDGTAYTLSSTGGDITNGEAGPGPVRAAPLAGEVDGLGIGDDEISFGDQSITVSFSETVRLTSAYFLDLFGAGFSSTKTREGVRLTVDGVDSAQFLAETLKQDGTVGFGSGTGLALIGSEFTFTALEGNDGFGNADFALAGIEISPVPLPAGALLLGAGLAGFGLSRRRKG